MEEPQHLVHEAYGDYRERMSSGNFIVWIFGGAFIVMVGIILLYMATGIVDRALFIGMILLGAWIMWKNVFPSRKKRYRDTAHRISYG